MAHLYAKMPDPEGTEHDFGAEKAALAASLPPIDRDIFVGSLIRTEMILRIKAGDIGEFTPQYEIRD